MSKHIYTAGCIMGLMSTLSNDDIEELISKNKLREYDYQLQCLLRFRRDLDKEPGTQ